MEKKGWSKIENLRLLEAYRKEECLWNTYNAYYGYHTQTTNSWIKVARTMNRPVSSVKDKVQNLMKEYRYLLQRQEDRFLEGKSYRPTWYAYNTIHDFMKTLEDGTALEKIKQNKCQKRLQNDEKVEEPHSKPNEASFDVKILVTNEAESDFSEYEVYGVQEEENDLSSNNNNNNKKVQYIIKETHPKPNPTVHQTRVHTENILLNGNKTQYIIKDPHPKPNPSVTRQNVVPTGFKVEYVIKEPQSKLNPTVPKKRAHEQGNVMKSNKIQFIAHEPQTKPNPTVPQKRAHEQNTDIKSDKVQHITNTTQPKANPTVPQNKIHAQSAILNSNKAPHIIQDARPKPKPEVNEQNTALNSNKAPYIIQDARPKPNPEVNEQSTALNVDKTQFLTQDTLLTPLYSVVHHEDGNKSTNLNGNGVPYIKQEPDPEPTNNQLPVNKEEDTIDLYCKLLAAKLRSVSELESLEIMYSIDGLILNKHRSLKNS